MKHRIATAIAATALALMVCAPFALADGLDEGSTQNLAIFLAICVVVASMLVMQLTNRHFEKKRKANERKNRARAKQKKRKR